MSDEEFLKRWSRRKQEAREADEAPTRPPPPIATEDVTEAAAQTPADAAVDLSKLPPVDSITATTDVTAFLRENIPLELSRAALRRAWAADPAIRDFVGLAENAWDFTDPTAMPGFGPLEHSPEQIAAMVERVVGGMRDAVEKMAAAPAGDAQNQSLGDTSARVPASAEKIPDPPEAASAIDASPEQMDAAVQPESSEDEDEPEPVRRRSHGGALPT